MNIGFIGLGHLGKAIAGRLAECGNELVVWNRTPEKAEGLDATPAATPAAVADRADILCLCMFDSRAVLSVLEGPEGLLAGAVRGKIIVDFTTNHFRDVLTCHELCRAAGARYLEAPVLGSVVPASKGALTILVSGELSAFNEAGPLLNQAGKHIFHLDDPGLASRMKLINNLALGSFMATLAEALAFAEDVGLEKSQVLDILSVGGGDSLVLNAKKAKLLEEDFSTHFSNALIHKDLHCLQDLAYERKRALFTGAVTKELFARTIEEGMADLDFSSIYQLFKR